MTSCSFFDHFLVKSLATGKKWVRKRPVNKALKLNCKLRRYKKKNKKKNFEVQGLLVSQYMDNQTTEESVDNNKHAKETLAITVSQCHRDYSNLSASIIHEASNEQHPVGSGLND